MWYLCTSILGILWRCSFVLFVVFADLQAQYNGGILIFQSAFVFVLLIADERLKLLFLLGIYNSKLENSQEKYIVNNYWTPLCDTLWLYLCFLVHRSVQGEAYTNIEGVLRFIRCSFQAPPTPWWYKSRKWWTSGQPCWISFYLRFNQIRFNPPKKIGQKCIGNQTNGKNGNQTKSDKIKLDSSVQTWKEWIELRLNLMGLLGN